MLDNQTDIQLQLINFDDYMDNIIFLDELGDYYFSIKNFDKSSSKYKKALEICLIISMNNDDRLKEIYPIETKLRHKISKSFVQEAEKFINTDVLKSLDLYQEALEVNSTDFLVYFKIGYCFHHLKRINPAIRNLIKSISINDNYSESYRVLADIYWENSQYYKALKAYERCAEIDPRNEYVYNRIGYLHLESYDISKAIINFRKSIELNGFFQDSIDNFLFTTIRGNQFSQSETYRLAVEMSNKFIKNCIDEKLVFSHTNRVKNKKIRIAYMSGDFRNQIIMNYVLPILENHDKKNFEVYCYCNNDRDYVTEKCESLVDNFYFIKDMDNYKVAKLIYDKNIDVLIDLSGHSAGNKIFSLVYKPAPIQVTYIGYLGTTGIDKIDYFLTNKSLSKIEEQEFFSEKLYFMDSVYNCFRHYSGDKKPDILELPYLKNKYITFGSFNNLSKITDEVIETWSEILKLKKDSKILICRHNLIEEYYYSRFESFGINKDRIIFKKSPFLNEYNNVDINLDTFPCSGVTITFDSIIMGIPVISILGDIFQSRHSSHINHHLGLDELVSYTKEEYISKAISLSNNINRLKELRLTLRDKLYSSDFYKHKEFTEKLEKAYLDMYSKYYQEQNI